MYIDSLLALSGSILGNTITPQPTFATGASVLSTNTIDLSTAGIPATQVRDLAEGGEFSQARIEVFSAFTGGTSAEFQVITADDAALTVNVFVIGTTGPLPVALLVAGSRFAARINPRLASKGQRYIGGRTVNIGANATGAIYMDLGAEVQDGQKFYPVGFQVL